MFSAELWKISEFLSENFHFFLGKLYRSIHFFSFFLLKNIDGGYSLEPPRRGGSNEYPQSMFSAELWKISEFLSENFHFLMVKFSVFLNRRVFVQAYIILYEDYHRKKQLIWLNKALEELHDVYYTHYHHVSSHVGRICKFAEYIKNGTFS